MKKVPRNEEENTLKNTQLNYLQMLFKYLHRYLLSIIYLQSLFQILINLQKTPINEERKNTCKRYLYKIQKLQLHIYKIPINLIIYTNYLQLLLSINLKTLSIQLIISIIQIIQIIQIKILIFREGKTPKLLYQIKSKKNEDSIYIHEIPRLYQMKKNKPYLQTLPNLKSIVRCFFTKPINFKLILITNTYVIIRRQPRHLVLARTNTDFDRQRNKISYLNLTSPRTWHFKQGSKRGKLPEYKARLEQKLYGINTHLVKLNQITSHLIFILNMLSDTIYNCGHYLFSASTVTQKWNVRQKLKTALPSPCVLCNSSNHDQNTTIVTLGNGLTALLYSSLMFLVALTIATVLAHSRSSQTPSSPRFLLP